MGLREEGADSAWLFSVVQALRCRALTTLRSHV